MGEKRDTHLAEPVQAVYDYLETLLNELPDTLEPATEEQIQEVVELEEAAPPVEEVVAEEVLETQAAPVEETVEQESTEPVVPEWAEEPFQCLLFRLRGMTLAVPLLSLDGILKPEGESTLIPGQPDWHRGVIANREQQVVVVDTAQLVMPERLHKAPEEEGVGSHILLIGGGRWGLTCDTLSKPVFLNKDEVRWSIDRPDKRWMAGTVIDKLCILLDIEGLLETIGHE
jgi:purine-binding chemotaxis protein CheW